MIASLDVSITREEVTIAGEVRFVVVVIEEIRKSSMIVTKSFKLSLFAKN